MIATYVYGTPHGFNFYENDPMWDTYFKEFYRTSRKGKQLRVNRRPDGTTVYSFLCYGLMECKGRESSFFGCSLIVDGNSYPSNLNTLFDWFDYLFEMLVQRGKLLHVNHGGKVQYDVDRFADRAEEVEWLKSNLPNIFTKSDDLNLVPYVSPYNTRNVGRVSCRNIDVSPERIADDFRHGNWIALSPQFQAEEEVDFTDLDVNLKKVTAELLSVAMNPNPSALPRLNEIESDCNDLLGMLKRFAAQTYDPKEQDACRSKQLEYEGIMNNVRQLKSKIKEPVNTPPPYAPTGLRKCTECGRKLPTASFPDPDVDVCGDCSRAERKKADAETRLCRKCREKKPVSAFIGKSDVCKTCEAKGSKTKISKEKDIIGKINPLYAAIALIAVVGVVSLILIFSGGGESDPQPAPDSNSFDAWEFDTYLQKGQYEDAADYASRHEDKTDSCMNVIAKKLTDKFNHIIISTEPSDRGRECNKFIETNRKILDSLGLSARMLSLAAGDQEYENPESDDSIFNNEREVKHISVTVKELDRNDKELRSFTVDKNATLNIPLNSKVSINGTEGNVPVRLVTNTKDVISPNEYSKTCLVKGELTFECGKDGNMFTIVIKPDAERKIRSSVNPVRGAEKGSSTRDSSRSTQFQRV